MSNGFIAQATFILIGAVTFAIVVVLLMLVVAFMVRILVLWGRQILRAHRLRKARKLILTRERARIARMIRDKSYEEDMLRFLNKLEQEIRYNNLEEN